MAKLERLLNLTAALLHTERPLTAEQIRERIPGYPDDLVAFRRAFSRDKEDLREMGVPITMEDTYLSDTPIDGYRIRKDDYFLKDPDLEPDELAALHMAARAIQFDEGASSQALLKLGGLTGQATGDAEQPLAAMPGSPVLSDLFGALTDRRLVQFGYRDEVRNVEPQRIDFQRGRWYLTAWDLDRQAERNFRVDRMGDQLSLGEVGSATRRKVGTARWTQPWELGPDQPIIARVQIDADQAGSVPFEIGHESVVERHDDGSVVVELSVTNESAFVTFVLSFLDHAEVLSPPELRDAVTNWCHVITLGSQQ
ncbi:MAG: helix-turn-helix transcriptional regulator [Acidimicrobiales bacterium]